MARLASMVIICSGIRSAAKSLGRGFSGAGGCAWVDHGCDMRSQPVRRRTTRSENPPRSQVRPLRGGKVEFHC